MSLSNIGLEKGQMWAALNNDDVRCGLLQVETNTFKKISQFFKVCLGCSPQSRLDLAKLGPQKWEIKLQTNVAHLIN